MTQQQAATPMPPRALVVGASGYIGSNLVPALQQHGYRVRALARDLNRLQVLGWHQVECIAADLLKPATLPAALAHVDIAYYLVHSMAAGGDFDARDRQAAANFAEAAHKAGVRHIVYLGSLTRSHTSSIHLRSREATGEELRRFGATVTELRAPIIIGGGSVPFEVMRDVVNSLPLMFMPRQMRSVSAPIALQNLLYYLVKIPKLAPEHLPCTYNLCGPEYLSYAGLMRRFARSTGRRFVAVPVPLLPVGLASRLTRYFSSAPEHVVSALLGGLAHDMRADDNAIRQLLPQKLLSVEDAIQQVIFQENTDPGTASWHHGNMQFRHNNPVNAYYGHFLCQRRRGRVDPEHLWHLISDIGGKRGYYFMTWLWRLRELMDAMVGGPGRQRQGREHAHHLVRGEHIDSWTIVAVQPEHQLLLRFNMKAPGAGHLCFEMEEKQSGEWLLQVTAYWHPRGIWGLLYWYLMMPAHNLLFWGMLKKMVKIAAPKQLNQTRALK